MKQLPQKHQKRKKVEIALASSPSIGDGTRRPNSPVLFASILEYKNPDEAGPKDICSFFFHDSLKRTIIESDSVL